MFTFKIFSHFLDWLVFTHENYKYMHMCNMQKKINRKYWEKMGELTTEVIFRGKRGLDKLASFLQIRFSQEMGE